MTPGKPRLYVDCSGLGETELQAVLLGDRASPQYDSISGKTVLKRPFIRDTGKASAHSLFRPKGDRSSSCSPGRQSFESI